MARLDFNEDDVIDFKDEELMELGKNRCGFLQGQQQLPLLCEVCNDDDADEKGPCISSTP